MNGIVSLVFNQYGGELLCFFPQPFVLRVSDIHDKKNMKNQKTCDE